MARFWFKRNPDPEILALGAAIDALWAEIYKDRDDVQEQIDRQSGHVSDLEGRLREVESNMRNMR